jgi:hypothetical protein
MGKSVLQAMLADLFLERKGQGVAKLSAAVERAYRSLTEGI